MRLKNYKERIDSIPLEVRELVKFNMDVLDRIHELLERKFEGKQVLLAQKMGKSEPEVSKWFNGYQNFTLKTLIKLQIAFGEPILAVCTDGVDNSTYVLAKTPRNSDQVTLRVSSHGLYEEKNGFENIDTSNINTSSIKPTPVS